MATWAKPNLDTLEERFDPGRPIRLVNRKRRLRSRRVEGSAPIEVPATQFLDSSATDDATGTRNPLPSRFGSPSAAQSGTTKLSRERSERLAARGSRPRSLDTEKHLATSERVSVAQWLKDSETPYDEHRAKATMHRTLLGSVHAIWQQKERDLRSAAELAGVRAHEAFWRNNQVHAIGLNETDPDFVQAWIAEAAERSAESARVLLIAEQERKRWLAQWQQIHNCQGEWIGYRAACCGTNTKPIAVPIGCNHRLCPLCAAHRAELARTRVRGMFDRLTHPAIITLTIPNLPAIEKSSYADFRARVRKFIKLNPIIQGGVYSLETTYKRGSSEPWHVHVHILADLASQLPTSKTKVEIEGRKMLAFTDLKMRLEFDWLRLWTSRWGKRPGKNASAGTRAEDEAHYRAWIRATRENAVREWRGGMYQDMELPAAVRADRTQWNRENRRVMDIRPVLDRERAALEVLKYITKVAAFSDLPEAIEPFMNAVKGTRLIQTFGTWYGLKLECDANEHDWSELQCSCGCNDWKRMGVFHRDDVRMRADGRWELMPKFTAVSDPTIPKARIPYFRDREWRDDERGRVFDVELARAEALIDNEGFAAKQQTM